MIGYIKRKRAQRAARKARDAALASLNTRLAEARKRHGTTRHIQDQINALTLSALKGGAK